MRAVGGVRFLVPPVVLALTLAGAGSSGAVAQESPGLAFLDPERGRLDVTLAVGGAVGSFADLLEGEQGILWERTGLVEVELAVPLGEGWLRLALPYTLRDERREGARIGEEGIERRFERRRIEKTGPLRVELEQPAARGSVIAGAAVGVSGRDGAGLQVGWRGRWVWDPLALTLEIRQRMTSGGSPAGSRGLVGADFAVNERVMLGGGVRVDTAGDELRVDPLFAGTLALGERRWLTVGALGGDPSLFVRLGIGL